MKIHFIAIGGSAMHNLAIALSKKGNQVTGSDDEIFEPSKTRLTDAGILALETGWFPDKITGEIDAVILGMHARKNNPELLRAQELGLKIYSYPEYFYEQTRNKKRVVIGGSHGKTTITSMIMHVLKYNGILFDWLVGARIDGFDTMVKLDADSKIAVIEGDEYLSSPIDMRPKFLLYKPHIALISGIAWDHMNVFPTFENYLDQFIAFVKSIEKGGTLVYCNEDENIRKITGRAEESVRKIPYNTHPYAIRNNQTYLVTESEEIPLKIFGKHNLQNLEGAMKICRELGLSDKKIYDAIESFPGASRRLQVLEESDNSIVFFDFAHSPSKLKATIDAVKEQFPNKKLVAIIELHTFSSLNQDFLPQYKGTMNKADTALVFFSPETVKHKKLKQLNPEQIRKAFDPARIEVFSSTSALVDRLDELSSENTNFLFMSSGNFAGLEIKELAGRIIKNSVK